MHRLRVSLVNFYPFQLLQSLDPGLDLIRLGRLVPELVDEVFCLLYHPLLVLIGRSLLGNTFSPELNILAVWHLVVRHVPQSHLNRAVGNIVQKLPVVGHQHQRAAIILQIILKPFN